MKIIRYEIAIKCYNGFVYLQNAYDITVLNAIIYNTTCIYHENIGIPAF